jgi:PPK2 family polyphosphate:nucleotide phosphotransferase
MYAENKHSMLVILQAMDAGGKDGTIRHVMEAWNPQSCNVVSFKVPSAEELAHDYLWRIHRWTPRKGQITVFNRSHYEDVLVVRVHSLVTKEVWSKRYSEINNFEQELVNNGTTIVKFYLHIDKDEQLQRFGNRLNEPDKRWKISDADYQERELWDEYQQAYEDAINKCSTDIAPWYVIPANHKWFRDLAVSQILMETMQSWEMKYPEPTVDLADIRLKYHSELAEEHGLGMVTTVEQESGDIKGKKKGKKKKKKK